MHNSDTLQVSFSVSSREQRRAGRRMWRYRTPDLKRRYWLATLLLVVIFAALFYGFSENVRRVTNFLWTAMSCFRKAGKRTKRCRNGGEISGLAIRMRWLAGYSI